MSQRASIDPCRFVKKIHLVDVGSGLALALIHGGQAWAYTWRYQLASLTSAGHRVVAPDLPGSGYSGLPRDYDHTIEGLADLLAGLLDALQIERPACVASPAGGLPVLDFAIRHPGRVTALVLASTCAMPYAEPTLWRLLRWPLVGGVMGLFVTARMVRSNLCQVVYDDSLITDDVVSAYHKPLHERGAWRANLKLERNWRHAWVQANLERITAPILMVWGQDDPCIR